MNDERVGAAGLTIQFAERLMELVRRQPGAAERRHAAVLLLDHLHCVHGGRDAAAPVAHAWWAQSPLDVAARQAARAHRTDWDDVHWPTLVHPGSVTWPVALVLGRRGVPPADALPVDALPADRLPADRLLAAVTVGYEATVRMARALGLDHRRRFHATATAGTVGAAACAVTVLGLGTAGLADAIGHAISVMGGAAGCLRERSGTRLFHCAHAVRTGVAAALAAADGMRATRHDLDRPSGLIPAEVAQVASSLLAADQGALSTSSVRPFPTSGWTQAVYEAARQAASLMTARACRVVATVPPWVAAASAGPSARGGERWYSIEWAIRDALGAERAGEPSDEPPAEIEVRSDERTAGATVECDTAAGGCRASVSRPLGHPDRPLTSEILGDKWGLSAVETDQMIDAVAADFTVGSAAARLADWSEVRERLSGRPKGHT
jgi:2-methylcitrate dehydratase PrpD